MSLGYRMKHRQTACDVLLPCASTATLVLNFPSHPTLSCRCIIESFDSADQQYRIRWADASGEKWVKRLNLRLEGETPATFRARLLYARRMKEEVSRTPSKLSSVPSPEFAKLATW